MFWNTCDAFLWRERTLAFVLREGTAVNMQGHPTGRVHTHVDPEEEARLSYFTQRESEEEGWGGDPRREEAGLQEVRREGGESGKGDCCRMAHPQSPGVPRTKLRALAQSSRPMLSVCYRERHTAAPRIDRRVSHGQPLSLPSQELLPMADQRI